MANVNVWERFTALNQDQAEELALPALRLPGSGTHYLAKGADGEPILLLRVGKRRVPRIPLGLKHVHAEFEVECAVRDVEESLDGEPVGATFCRAVCDPMAPGLHSLFINSLVGTVEILPPMLSPEEVDHFFDDMVELFRLFSSPPKMSVMGLWGELLVILASPLRNVLLTGWHLMPEATFDFTFPNAHIEVKATTRQNRQHEFSLKQVRGNSQPTLLASLVLEQSDAGESVFELANAIQEELTLENRSKLWKLIAQSLGSDVDNVDEIKFLRSASLSSLRFYDTATLPAPEVLGISTQCISGVRFSLDLDLVPNIKALPPRDVWQAVAQGVVD